MNNALAVSNPLLGTAKFWFTKNETGFILLFLALGISFVAIRRINSKG